MRYHLAARMQLHAGLDYSMSEASFDPIKMPSVSEDVLSTIEAGYYDYSMIHNYSDLSYKWMRGNVGGEYSLSDKFAITLDLDYWNLNDAQGWVYGDETGSFYVIRAGFRVMSLGY